MLLLIAFLILTLLESDKTPLAFPDQYWFMEHEKLNDYELAASQTTLSMMLCIFYSTTSSEVHLVTFNSSTGVCSAFRCRMGLSHCRKCRNANQGNQLVWVKKPSCWITVQHRVSGSVDFYRNWSDYKAGFGEGPDGNFWIGLDQLHSLTFPGAKQLTFLMRLWNGTESWAQYSSFSVGPESESYKLNASGFSGSPGIQDSVAYGNGMGFSTMDRDNDRDNNSCSIYYVGAWWYNACHNTNPNGEYFNGSNSFGIGRGILWSIPYGFSYSLNEIEILVI